MVSSVHSGRRTYPLFAGILLLLSLGNAELPALTGSRPMEIEPQFDPRGDVRAPELDGGRGWFNVDERLRLSEELRGKVVLLDFWTYCCINCLHVIPDLKALEEEFAEELVVVGVHSAKFTNEQQAQNIRNAILRYEIEHPVVNDADFRIWRQYAVRAWPTFVLINPAGRIVLRASGEGRLALLRRAIRLTIAAFDDEINREPITLSLERDRRPATQLAFPGKVYADPENDRLIISDTNHHRLLVTDRTGLVRDIIGGGPDGRERGLVDGGFETARLRFPQGVARLGEHVYVADTKNHAIRRIDWEARTVETVAGTGEKEFRAQGGEARRTPLNSPWDVVELDGRLYIAMAGQHQLWVYDPAAGTVQPYAGTRGENIVDGPRDEALLAQPSGLATDGRHLYFADSETSALRMVERGAADNGTRDRVRTLVGAGLFVFGLADGPFAEARMQHCMGVAYHDGVVYVADAYNHAIRAANLAEEQLSTLAGTGERGLGTPDAPRFDEPSGISYADGKLYVADTNNHAIRVIDLETRRTTTLQLDFTEVRARRAAEAPQFGVFGEPVELEAPSALQWGDTLAFALTFPADYSYNELAPPTAQLRIHPAEGEPVVSVPVELPLPRGDDGEVALNEPLTLQLATLRDAVAARWPDQGPVAGDEPVRIEVAVVVSYCRKDGEGMCLLTTLRLDTQVQAADQAQPPHRFHHTLPAPAVE